MIEKADFIIDQFAIPQQPTGNTNKTTEDETEPTFSNTESKEKKQ